MFRVEIGQAMGNQLREKLGEKQLVDMLDKIQKQSEMAVKSYKKASLWSDDEEDDDGWGD